MAINKQNLSNEGLTASNDSKNSNPNQLSKGGKVRPPKKR